MHTEDAETILDDHRNNTIARGFDEVASVERLPLTCDISIINKSAMVAKMKCKMYAHPPPWNHTTTGSDADKSSEEAGRYTLNHARYS